MPRPLARRLEQADQHSAFSASPYPSHPSCPQPPTNPAPPALASGLARLFKQMRAASLTGQLQRRTRTSTYKASADPHRMSGAKLASFLSFLFITSLLTSCPFPTFHGLPGSPETCQHLPGPGCNVLASAPLVTPPPRSPALSRSPPLRGTLTYQLETLCITSVPSGKTVSIATARREAMLGCIAMSDTIFGGRGRYQLPR